MPPSPRSFLLTDLSWVEVQSHLRNDRRLLVPVGACDQYGPHLPLGAGTVVSEAIAATLAQEFGVLRAPTLPYGVNLPAQRAFAGQAALHEKTLHRVLNDLLASWEDHGFDEFILLTAHNHDPHVEALASVSGTRARVRVIEVLGIDFSDFLEGRGGPEHGGEVLTSLMLYLRPEKVNLDLSRDFPSADDGEVPPPRRITRLSAASPGSIGQPTLATAEKGERLFQHIVQRIRVKVFLSPPEQSP